MFVWLIQIWSEIHEAPSSTAPQLEAVRVAAANDRTQPKIVREPGNKPSFWADFDNDKKSVWDGALPATDSKPLIVEPFPKGVLSSLATASVKVHYYTAAPEPGDFVSAAEFRGVIAGYLSASDGTAGERLRRCLEVYGLNDLTKRAAQVIASTNEERMQDIPTVIRVGVALGFACEKVNKK